MKTTFEFTAEKKSTALVIVFPPGVKGLFNPEVHSLVREVQEQLDGVYVTYAFSTGSSPDLPAAMAAARFVGCESAVVVPAANTDIIRLGDRGLAGDWLLSQTSIESDFDAPAVIGAYLTAVSEAGRAA